MKSQKLLLYIHTTIQVGSIVEIVTILGRYSTYNLQYLSELSFKGRD